MSLEITSNADELIDTPQTDNSPEAAGLARGSMRTAASALSKRAAVGRLPKAVSKPIRVPSPPRALPKRIRLQRVAKVSDRLSTGFDAYEAASSTVVTKESTSTRDKKKVVVNRRDKIISHGKNVIAFSGTLLKNTILGAAAFETYEKTISYFDSRTSKSDKDCNIHHNHQHVIKSPFLMKEDAFSRASVSQHFGAGACAGSIHAILSILQQSTSYLYQQQQQIKMQWNHHLISKKAPWGFSYTIHHTLAHSVLFSSYEWTRRFLRFEVMEMRKDDINHENKSEQSPFFSVDNDVIIIGVSGGIAGQIQHIVSHYTEQIFNLNTDNVNVKHSLDLTSKNGGTQSNIQRFLATRGAITAPSLTSIMVAFFPSALGFLAFEFGKEIMS